MDAIQQSFNEDSSLYSVRLPRTFEDIAHDRYTQISTDKLQECADFNGSGDKGFEWRRIRNQAVILGTLLAVTAYFYSPLPSFLLILIACMAIVAALSCCVEGQQNEWLMESLKDLGRTHGKFLESEKMCRLLVETIRGIVYTTDYSGTITYVSPKLKETTGWRASDLIGLDFAHILEESERRKVRLLFRRLLQQGGIGTGELRIKTKDGSLITGELKAIIIRGSDNTPKGCFGIVRDISKRLQKEPSREAGKNLPMCLPQAANADKIDENSETKNEAFACGVACDLNNWPTLTLSAKQISRILGISKAAVSKRARKEHWEYDPMVKQGGLTRFFFVDKTPEPTRTRIKNRLNLAA